jgi:atypical dual specificity phosphatase
MLRNFSWIIPDRLAGMALPTSAYQGAGAIDPTGLDEDLQELKQLGIKSVVSLTHDPLHADALRQYGFHALHLPIPDMTPPSYEQILRFVNFIDGRIEYGGIVVHCTAGIGRTGTMLAGYLVWQGTAPEQAIEEIRRYRSGSIETSEQEAVILHFSQNIQKWTK